MGSGVRVNPAAGNHHYNPALLVFGTAIHHGFQIIDVSKAESSTVCSPPNISTV
jgi:hypothetical protein